MIERDAEEVEAGEVFVDGSIDGRPYRFLLDTGAATSRVACDDHTSRFASTEKDRSSGVFARSSDDLITVPSLQLGPVSRMNVAMGRVTGLRPAVASLIGMDVLKDLRLQFDFASNRLGIDPDDDSADSCTFHEIIFDTRFHPYVDVHLGAETARAVWDSGASITVVDTSFVARDPSLFEEAVRSTGTDSTGSEVSSQMFVMSEARIGGLVFPPHRVAAVDLSFVNSTIDIPMDLILGYSTLRHADWLLDFPGRRWAILQMRGATRLAS